MTNRTILIKTDGTKIETVYPDPVSGAPRPKLEDLQKAVGGYIELVPGIEKYEGSPCVVYSNGEGKLEGLPLNPTAQDLWNRAYGTIITTDHLVGDVVIITGTKKFVDG